MNADDSDWAFAPETVDIDRYKGQRPDSFDQRMQGLRVLNLRTLTDMPVGVLAASAGLTLIQLLAIESGLMVLSEPAARRLSKALGVRFEDLWID